jgi:hypothetical protein
MATIERYETSSGATLYRVRHRTPNKRQTDKRGFRTKRDAQAWAEQLEVDGSDAGHLLRDRDTGLKHTFSRARVGLKPPRPRPVPKARAFGLTSDMTRVGDTSRQISRAASAESSAVSLSRIVAHGGCEV